MIYKYTKCESVIAKILADSDMSEKNMRITDIREWIFEAIEHIGAPMQYIQKESGQEGCPILKIHENQVPIPEDMHDLNGIAYSNNPNGPWIPVRSETATFKEPVKHKFTHHEPEQPMRYKLPTAQSQFYGNNLVKYADDKLNSDEDVTYFTKPGWFVFNKPEGYIKLAYKAIATDERGYPLIPDSASYQEAIYWYVMWKLSFSKYLKGSLGGSVRNSANVYYYLQQQWNFFRAQAYAEAMMPTETDMRSIKNEWNKLVPEWDGDDTFFKNVGRKQLNYNDYYYGY